MPGTSGADREAQREDWPRRSRRHNTLEIFYDYFTERIEERRRAPRGDVLSGMAAAIPRRNASRARRGGAHRLQHIRGRPGGAQPGIHGQELTVHDEIRIDRDRCMGSSGCVGYAPNTFDQDDDTVAVVVNQHGDPAEKIQAAIASCPARAISLIEIS
jgi:ferredoxin